MTVIICIGSSCHLKGSRFIVEGLKDLIQQHHLEERVTLKGSFCLGNCVNGVSVKIDEKIYSVSKDHLEEFFNEEILGRVN